jgi:hypothetical protein
MKFDDRIFYEMIEEGTLPASGIFDITDEMKEKYVLIYSKYSGNGDFKTRSNRNYALKLAGISLLKLNKQREELKEVTKKTSVEKSKSGIVYLISNSAFDGFLKIGMTQNLVNRLRSYQTYDPMKRFKENITESSKMQDKKKNIT